MRDLKPLEETGIDIGDNKCLKVAVFDAPGDNLGINVLFGFSGGFNATYFCRLCRSTKTDTHFMTFEDDSTVRSAESYDEQILKLKVNPDFGYETNERCEEKLFIE